MGRDIGSRLDSLKVSDDTVEQVSHDSYSQLARLQSEFTLLRNTIHQGLTLSLDQETHETVQFRKKMGALYTDIVDSHRQGQDSVKATIKQETLQIRAEMESLRDTLLERVTGNQCDILLSPAEASLLDDGVNTRLVNQIRHQLIMTPSSLKDTCDKTDLVKDSNADDSGWRQGLLKKRCNHSYHRTQSTHWVGPLLTAYKFSTSAALGCRRCQSHKRSLSYSVFVRLLPIIQRTIAVTFAARSGAGGHSIGMSLRYFGTVERAKSPAFQLFDDFSSRYAPTMYRNKFPKKPYLIDARFIVMGGQFFDRKFRFDWYPKALDTKIPELCRELSSLLSSGRCSASYSDEYGNTLLHVRT